MYYEDTDFSGVVYHASYLRFLERGRTEFLRQTGFLNRELAATRGLVFAVRSLQIEYLAPAAMDDLLRIDTKVAKVSGASAKFQQFAFRDEKTIVSAEVLVVALVAGRPTRFPKPLHEVLGQSIGVA